MIMKKKKISGKRVYPKRVTGVRIPPTPLGSPVVAGSMKNVSVCGNVWQDVAMRGIETDKKPTLTVKNRHETDMRPKRVRMRNIHVSLYYRNRPDKNGTAPLLLAINYAGSSTYVPVGNVRLRPDQWDGVRRRVVNHAHAQTINSSAQSMLGRAEDAVLELMRDGGVRGWKLTEVRDAIVSFLYPVEKRDNGVVAVMEEFMGTKDKPNTADKYQQTITHLERGLGSGARRVDFADVTAEWLGEFDRWLSKNGLSVNSRSIHMRNIRAVFNYAVAKDLTDARYPFKSFKIKSQATEPMALTLEQMRMLWGYEPPLKAQRYWLDVWKLMFCLIGINMADLWRLERIVQGRVSYERAKTGRLYSIKVEPEAKMLIEAHKGRKVLVDLSERYKSAHRATASLNKMMKAIAKDLKLPPITGYTARYTWATLAASIDIPIETISQALGHTYGLAVTLGYIMPDRRKVDEANRRVLDLVNS